MKRQEATSMKWAALVPGALVVLWGGAGFVMAPGYGETGFFYGPDYRVRAVEEGRTAEAAGIRLGDHVRSVDGVPVEELPMQSRWRTRQVGATAEVVLEREGGTVTSSVTFGGTPPERRIRSIRNLIVNVAFIVFGLWAYLSVGTPLAGLLVGIGLARGLASFPGPHLGPRFEGIGANIQLLGILAFTFLLLRFFLEVPRRRRLVETGTGDPPSDSAIRTGADASRKRAHSPGGGCHPALPGTGDDSPRRHGGSPFRVRCSFVTWGKPRCWVGNDAAAASRPFYFFDRQEGDVPRKA